MNKPIDFCMQQVSRVPSLPFGTLSSLPREVAVRTPPTVFNLPRFFLRPATSCRRASVTPVMKRRAWQLLLLYPQQDIHGKHNPRAFGVMFCHAARPVRSVSDASRHGLTCRRTQSIDLRALSYKTLRMWARLSLPLPSARCISGPNIGNVCMPLKQSALFIQSPWTSRIRKFLQWILIG